jgi:predicted alpha-1,2-mannosidase
MKIKISTIFLTPLLISNFFIAAAFGQQQPVKSLTRLVDPFIGSGFHGHVFVGANVPFGAVQLGPTNISKGWDWCSGYHISDSTIVGFQHTHLSGTGIGDLGDISFMPTTGPVKVTKGTQEDLESGYVSKFSHKQETVHPGFYAVKLLRYNIDVRLTATQRVGFHEYTFPKSSRSNVIIDLQEGVADVAVKTFIQQINKTTIAGYRYSKGWAKDQRIYFAAVFSKPIAKFSVYDSLLLKPGNLLLSKDVKGVVTFKTEDNEKILIKVGISPVSTENALANIAAELPAWDFDKTVAAADALWNKELDKVELVTADDVKKKIFYTALYHTMIAPSTFNDHDGSYRGVDKKVYPKSNFTNLTTFSLWDTYRAANPLYTILQPERVDDMVNSMLAIYQQQGKLPIWHLMGNETNTMVGYSAVPVVVDAFLKGFKGFDANLAYEAVKTTAMRDDKGLNFVKSQGFIPAESTVESVAMGLEYSIDDYSIAQMAKKLGRNADYEYFAKRGQNYKNYFDQETKFMRGRISRAEWRKPFSPFVSRHEKDDYTEGNAWQYTWLVPQDVEGLIGLLGGERAFQNKLDSLFVVEGDMGDEASNDITGLIGQYAHGNEPSHHITYLYSYIGQPWKTADKVRFIMDKFYTDKVDGIIGNEDVGQMSAWYLFSSLGFYPVNPANGSYVFGSPIFDEVSLKLPAGKSIHIIARNNSDKNIYIQKVMLNGKAYTKSYIKHSDLVKGGELIFFMGEKPNLDWGKAPADRPSSDQQ